MRPEDTTPAPKLTLQMLRDLRDAIEQEVIDYPFGRPHTHLLHPRAKERGYGQCIECGLPVYLTPDGTPPARPVEHQEAHE